VRGEKTGHRPPGQTKVCPHTAAITHLQTADKLAAIMRILTLSDYDLPGSHTRSLSFQRQPKAIQPASDGQPENCVGNFWRFPTPLTRKNITRSVSGSIPMRERGKAQLRAWEIGRLAGRLRCDAATRQASSYRDWGHLQEIGRLAGLVLHAYAFPCRSCRVQRGCDLLALLLTNKIKRSPERGPSLRQLLRSNTSAKSGRLSGQMSEQPRTISHDETSLAPLAPTPRTTNIKQKENISTPAPQVEGLDNRHSANRLTRQDNHKSAKLQSKSPKDDCPFDCHHGIANTHGNLMLPARNKE